VRFLETMADTQPKVASGGGPGSSSGGGGGGAAGSAAGGAAAGAAGGAAAAGGGSGGAAAAAKAGGSNALEDAVMEKAGELLAKLPADYIEDEYRQALKDIGGLAVPLNTFLFQEIQRLQNVIAKVRGMLTQMQQAIRGEVVMTSELQGAMTDLFSARVPQSWVFTPGGDEFSWLSPTLGLWFATLLDRDDQARTWLRHGRPHSFHLASFFNPQGFLTSMQQEVVRAHAGQKWALNEVQYYTEVTEFDRLEQLRAAPKEGVYVHGLYLDGARWDKHGPGGGVLAESEPKRLFSPLPVLMVTALHKNDNRLARTSGFYEAPCYRYPRRTDRHLVFTVQLPIRRVAREHWVLRGVALLCTPN
jgi:dynein heavy chain